MTTPDNDWNRKSDILWQQGDRQGAINTVLAEINAGMPKISRPAGLKFSYYLFQLQDYQGAARVLTDLVQQNPADWELLENRAVLLLRLGKATEAVTDFQQVATQAPDRVNAWDGLTNALYQLQRWSEAEQAGSVALFRKDRLLVTTDLAIDWPQISVTAWDMQRFGRDVIAFSLWGQNPRYLRGAIRNLQEAPVVYPGWVFRFYIDDSVPAEFVDLAIKLGAQIVQQPPNQTLRQKLSWRFNVANDPTVGRFLVRDADAVVSRREAQAVQEWLSSDCWFHVMRDYWTHTDLMLAGMWGGRAGLLPPLEPLILAYQSGRLETPNIDQWFLRDRIWPLIRSSTLIHDRCFRVLDARPWPEPDPPGNWHVGQDEATARPLEQTQKLGDLVNRYAWLQIGTVSPTAQPAPEPMPEPVPEPVPELVSEPVPEPVSEPVPEPVPELVPEPVPKSIALPTPKSLIWQGYWINLDRAIERRQSMGKQLQAAGLISYQRVSGVDGTLQYAGLPQPGVMGCWQSHLEVLRQGVQTGKSIHVLEDDTWLGDPIEPSRSYRLPDILKSVVNSGVLDKFDLVFTDVLLDYATSQKYFRAFYEAARLVPAGTVPSKIHFVNLRDILFTGTSSYFIAPASLHKVIKILEQEFRSLNLQNPEPIDMVIRRLVNSGKITAAVTGPFLTSIDLKLMTLSEINSQSDGGFQKSLLLHSIHRQAFFYGANDRFLLDLLEQQFPTHLRSQKSQVLGFLHEQLLIEEQSSF
jgi:tetratricopeptide (TPR) repeat protein/GR25 family glycosyltransferase involved in LPS biosynthesis